MKTKLFFILIILSAFLSLEAQKTSFKTWEKILKAADVEWNDVYEICPHFPKNVKDNATFNSAISKWHSEYPDETTAFLTLEKVVALNPSPYYLGFPVSDEPEYNNSWIQWIKGSNVSDRRMQEIAPNFPNMELEDEEFNFQFDRWVSLYGHEYANVINAKELTASNPNYSESSEVFQMPHFIGPLESIEAPLLKENASREETLEYELKLMNWYFVFEYSKFRKQYGFTPKFPEFFNIENYRASIIRKIEETEKQKQHNNFESN